jgi:hypothetical protein
VLCTVGAKNVFIEGYEVMTSLIEVNVYLKRKIICDGEYCDQLCPCMIISYRYYTYSGWCNTYKCNLYLEKEKLDEEYDDEDEYDNPYNPIATEVRLKRTKKCLKKSISCKNKRACF